MDELDALTAWLAAHGGRHDDVGIRRTGGDRAIVARRPIAAGATVVQVPRPLVLTRELAKASSIGRQIRDANLHLSGTHALLAAWLLIECHDPRSPFAPYLAMLPRDLTGFPILASAADRALLTGTMAGRLVDEIEADLAADHAALQAKVRLYQRFELAQLTWARLCIGSRLFSVAVDSVDTFALVPFADLLNHDAGRASTWTYDQTAEAFTITTAHAHAAGDEICGSYGRKGNGRLLVHYGFSLDGNPDDEAALRFPLPAGARDPRPARGHDPTPARFYVPRDPAHPASQALLTWLRQHHPDDTAVRAALTAAVDTALAALPATAPADDALLAGPSLSPDGRNAVRVRRGERAVLTAWRALASDGPLPPPPPTPTTP